jgi:hypothetical protein
MSKSSRKAFGWDALAMSVADAAAANFYSRQGEWEGDSQIESLLLTAVYWRREMEEPFIDLTVIERGADPSALPRALQDLRWDHVVLGCQIQLPTWRVDFLVHAPLTTTGDGGKITSESWRQLIVECDGHDFHERTKEQAARDRARDRQAQIDGYTIMRFTGSEIWRDPWACAKQVMDWASQV